MVKREYSSNDKITLRHKARLKAVLNSAHFDHCFEWRRDAQHWAIKRGKQMKCNKCTHISRHSHQNAQRATNTGNLCATSDPLASCVIEIYLPRLYQGSWIYFMILLKLLKTCFDIIIFFNWFLFAFRQMHINVRLPNHDAELVLKITINYEIYNTNTAN